MTIEPSLARRMLRGARLRTTLAATLVVAVVLGAAAVVAVFAQREALIGSIEDRLHQRADDVQALVDAGNLPTNLTVASDDDIIQLIGPDGQVIAASDNLRGSGPVASAPSGADRLRTISGVPVDEGDFRLLSRRVDAGGGYVLHVGAALDDVDESVIALTGTLSLVLPAVLAVLAGLFWVVAGRALSRVDAAQKRQDRFLADASHELRSPLTSIRSELEVDLAEPGEADLVATHRSVLDETVRLQRLVDDLLFLARSREGAVTQQKEPVDLDDIVLRESMALRARVGNRLAIDTSKVSGAQVLGDPDQLGRAVRNLLDNAERHAARNIEVVLAETNGHAEFAVADDGPGIPADQTDRIFERFTRVDSARDRSSGGAGLGLAITREIVDHHGGTVFMDPSAPARTRFVVRIPLPS